MSQDNKQTPVYATTFVAGKSKAREVFFPLPRIGARNIRKDFLMGGRRVELVVLENDKGVKKQALDGVFLAYDVTDRGSLEYIPKFFEDYMLNYVLTSRGSGNPFSMVLVGVKPDPAKKVVLGEQEAIGLVQQAIKSVGGFIPGDDIESTIHQAYY